MYTKLILNKKDGSHYGTVPSIDINRVLDAKVIQHVDTFFVFSYKVHGDNAFVFTEAGGLCILDDEELQ